MQTWMKRAVMIITIIIIAAAVMVVAVLIAIRVRNVRETKEELSSVTEEELEAMHADEEAEELEASEEPEPEPGTAEVSAEKIAAAAVDVAAETAEEIVEDEDPYILPDSSTRVYTLEELDGLSKADLRIARNEIYARHGRRFDSQDLQEYFYRKSWYKGTTDPENFDPDELNEIELENIAVIEEAEALATTYVTDSMEPEDTDTSYSVFEASWEVIKDYGFDFDSWMIYGDYHSDEWSYSPLSYTLVGGSAVDDGDYYTVRAVFARPLKVPADPQPGDTYTAVVNDLTGETETFTYVSEEGTGAEYYRGENGEECYISNIGTDGMAELLEGSADRIDVPFYDGVLRVSKDAETGAAVLRGPYETVDESDFEEDTWFNAVAFDESGFVMQLIYVGD